MFQKMGLLSTFDIYDVSIRLGNIQSAYRTHFGSGQTVYRDKMGLLCSSVKYKYKNVGKLSNTWFEVPS